MEQPKDTQTKTTVLPARLAMATIDGHYDLLFAQTERLYYTNSTEFVSELAEELNFPRWFEDERCGMWQTLEYFDIIVDGKTENLPMNASIYFYRRPLDGKICAIASYMGSVTHYHRFRSKVEDLFPQIKGQRREKVVEVPMVQMDFRRWLLEGQDLETVLGRPVIKLRAALMRDLLRSKHNLDEPYITSPGLGGKNSWTRRELAEEVKGNTKFAADMMVQMINLAANMLLKDPNRKE